MYTSVDIVTKTPENCIDGYGFSYLKNTSETCEAKALLSEVIQLIQLRLPLKVKTFDRRPLSGKSTVGMFIIMNCLCMHVSTI